MEIIYGKEAKGKTLKKRGRMFMNEIQWNYIEIWMRQGSGEYKYERERENKQMRVQWDLWDIAREVETERLLT